MRSFKFVIVFVVLVLLSLPAFAQDIEILGDCIPESEAVVDIVFIGGGPSGRDILGSPVSPALEQPEVANLSRLIDIGALIRDSEANFEPQPDPTFREVLFVYATEDAVFFEYREDWHESTCWAVMPFPEANSGTLY